MFEFCRTTTHMDAHNDHLVMSAQAAPRAKDQFSKKLPVKKAAGVRLP